MITMFASLALAGGIADGAAAYDDGQLDEAMATWTAPREAGQRTSAIAEYNVGTSYLRRGDPARAIAHLRSAARLRPRDGRIHHNLALARAAVSKAPPAVGMPSAWMSVVTPGELGLLGLLLVALGSGTVVAARAGRGPGTALGAGALAVGLALGGVAVAGEQALTAHPIVVITEEEAVLRDGAMVDAGERFRLPLGTEVRVERSYHGFYLIEDGRGRRGWLAAGAAEPGW